MAALCNISKLLLAGKPPECRLFHPQNMSADASPCNGVRLGTHTKLFTCYVHYMVSLSAAAVVPSRQADYTSFARAQI